MCGRYDRETILKGAISRSLRERDAARDDTATSLDRADSLVSGERRRVSIGLVILGALALVHAGFVWSPGAALRFGAVAVGSSLGAELFVVRAGWLDHRLEPQVWGVPLAALSGWVAAIYGWYQVAVLFVPGVAPIAAALLATGADLVIDPFGVRAGLWSYPRPGVPGPRLYDVPWWNFAGWFVLTVVVTTIGTPT